MKIERELLKKYLVRDIGGRDESVYIFPRIIEIDFEGEGEENTNEENNDTSNGTTEE